ncbi:RNA polymerase sigma factor [Clostridium folliculivorans]|uniref:RNA polymerase sigma factor n=1 Tax=Clostridium folliculivorans TaxID=2886038 RepID=UPI0021C4BF14|nr:sigma-70 family RNA polymerase sigma factor [Clostridium folliculivorans]GKU28384.1 DNA-directed RNA polymerase sigma-70 factor [Clostridium folliculivorans]
MYTISQYDSNYYREKIEAYGNTVYKICRLYLKENADIEDVFQKVFLKLIEKKPSFKDNNHEHAWFIKVTANTCKDFLKSYWNKNTVPINDIDSATEDIELSEVFEAVFSLEPKYKIVIYMYYYEGYPTSEISNILKVNQATIRTRLKRARDKLKNKLERDEFYE